MGCVHVCERCTLWLQGGPQTARLDLTGPVYQCLMQTLIALLMAKTLITPGTLI